MKTFDEYPSHAIGMSNQAASARIEEDYAGSAPYQWSLELIRNGMQQPGTTYIAADIIRIPSGALKRAIINNGPALNEDQLNDYMTTIGQGSGETWRLHNTLGNRHAGARTALLPWTDLIVLSWDETASPGGLAMKLFKNPVTLEYEYTAPTRPDPELLKILTGRNEVRRAGHGVAFICAGRDENVDGPFVDPNIDKGESDYAIIDTVRDRIHDPVGVDGQTITITVSAPMPAAPGKNFGGRKVNGSGGASYRLDSRTIQGHGPWAARAGVAQGTVVIDENIGVKIRWTLLNADARPDERRLPFGGKGHIIALYKSESMVLAAPGASYDLPAKMRLFGVHLGDVYTRLALEIIGPTDGGSDPNNLNLHLHQDPTRSRIILSNGQELPLAQWGEQFIAKMPPEILQANKAARERVASTKVTLKAGDRIKARIQSRLNSVIQSRRRRAGTGVLGPSGSPGTDYPNGEVITDHTLPGGPASSSGVDGLVSGGNRNRSRPNPPPKPGAKRHAKVTPVNKTNTRRRIAGSEKATEVQPRPAPVPDVKAFTSQDWASQGLDPKHLVSWDHSDGVVYFNMGHPIMETQIAFFSGEWLEQNPRLRRRVQDEEVRNAIVDAYAAESIGRILHYLADQGLAQAKTDLTDGALTISAHGFENVQDKIEDSIRKAARHGVVASVADTESNRDEADVA
jgi:hypothetical protein